jgi:superfamily II DNA or RNA helicase
MEPADWQAALRRQFGKEQNFGLENLGTESLFSDFAVTNPASKRRYKVAIRGEGLGDNYCSCPDFATNDLGTCKHIEFTLARLREKRGGKAALKRGYSPAFSEIFLHYGGHRGVRFRAGSDCPEVLKAWARALFPDTELPRARFGDLAGFVQAATEMGVDLRCYEDALAFVAEVRDGARRREILDTCYPEGPASPALITLLKVPLYAYQAEGALFAARAGRVLIGDEMGLGKTIQAIAAAELLARHFGIERVLVICPTSLKHQWKKEFERFSDREAQVIAGLRVRREELYRAPVFCKITNYETLARDGDLIRTWGPDLVILDEAQRIKNWNTIAAHAVKSIASPYAVVLTGTPLENRLEELISIVQFVDQHRLGPTWRLLDEHQARDDRGRVIGYQGLDRIGTTLAPVMLRRRKKEVLDQLPERVDNTLFVPMTPQQQVHHDDSADIVARIVSRWRRTGYLSETDQRRLTCALQIMRMSCNSTFLVDKESDFGYKADELMAVLEEILSDPQAKVVIFSQWLGTHELIIRRLAQPGRETWGHVMFHGGVPSEKRGALVDRFHEDPDCRLFLSTDAGGVGLNLQHAAATVINMDLPWNPAVLEQRIGRVHRMGQQKSVQVVNFVAQGTIEEGMLSVLAFKKSLFAGVLDGGTSDISLSGTRLSKFMESVEQVAGAGREAAEREEREVEDATGEAASAQPEFEDVGEEASGAPAEIAGPAPGTPLPPQEDKPEAEAPASESATTPVSTETPAAPANPWAPLLDVGLQLMQTLAAAHSPAKPADSSTSGQAAPPSWLETDARTGQTYLKLPVPEPAVVQKLADALSGLLAGLKR